MNKKWIFHYQGNRIYLNLSYMERKKHSLCLIHIILSYFVMNLLCVMKYVHEIETHNDVKSSIQ